MSCTSPNGCDTTDRYNDCRGCYWYRNPDKSKPDKENKKDVK